jgi:hypothetical protein
MNALTDMFGRVAHLLKTTEGKIPVVVSALEADGPAIEQAVAVALPLIQTIAALAPSRSLAELTALGGKYLLYVNPAMATNPVQAESILRDAALSELKKTFPLVDNGVLRLAIDLAFRMFEQNQKVQAATNTAKI